MCKPANWQTSKPPGPAVRQANKCVNNSKNKKLQIIKHKYIWKNLYFSDPPPPTTHKYTPTLYIHILK